ncbi:M3 family oligoendopeptidase [Acidaminobacter hydrogenoformans]|uniref:Oligoendopeptidase, pepF/M3 family n=1 Tax=Acidaminobacter hydrogenoformans DSM 2784 TaxID=1120920 RepID=A0A1G5RYE9_9FIRM|nr:M3 family oligoendopeptidase [Acidaminobacter hydrogenoformans]SCZ79144.1 oligoendopeptidase, pepF/M3 family [Acidaminobacter hydrogenoformans DSM 2784]
MSHNWRLDALYLSFEDQALKTDYQSSLTEARALIQESIILTEGSPEPETFEKLLRVAEALYLKLWKLSAFASLTLSADTSCEPALALEEKVRRLQADLTVFEVRLNRAAGRIDDVKTWLESSNSDYLKDLEFSLSERAALAHHLLSDEEETLIAKLRITGSDAWETLHARLTSTLMTDLPDVSGQITATPLSATRALAHDPDPEVRRRAYLAELAAFPKIEDSVAASLNAIKGEVLTLTERRRYASPLEGTLKEARMTKQTLDALISAIEEKLPALRAYYKAKATLLGDENGLKFHNLFAPVGTLSETYTYESAMDFVVRHFTTFNPELGAFAAKARDEQWIDVEPKAGKVGGAFCSSLYPVKQCRILTNFQGSLGDVLTLAHELGHGYHDYRLETQKLFNIEVPMTLAETASTFCETVIADAALATLSDADAMTVLESSLQDAGQAIVDIYSRYRFESRLFELRADHALSVNELKEEMLKAQEAAYGDALDPEVRHPYMWLVKGHYYSASVNFYNFPYAFGLLFAKGLYQLYREEGKAFLPRYDKLLAESGKASVESVCASVGIDVTTKVFWLKSLDVILGDIKRFETLAKK